MAKMQETFDENTIFYTPNGPLVGNTKRIFHNTRIMWNDLLKSRELIWRLFVRDFSSKYRQSILGIMWTLLTPLVTVAMFIGMNRAGLLKVEGINIPYALFAIIGLSIWSMFSIGIGACSNAILSAGSMVVKINFPKVALVISASLQGVVEFFVRAILIAFVFIWYGITPSFVGVIMGILALLPMYLLFTGLGFIFALATTIIRDLSNVIGMALTGLMFLTPILYPISGDSFLAKANVWNPLNYLINVPRDLIVQGNSKLLNGYYYSSVLSIIIFYLGWRFFHIAQTKIAERV